MMKTQNEEGRPLAGLLFALHELGVEVSGIQLPCQGEGCEEKCLAFNDYFEGIDSVALQALESEDWDNESVLCSECAAKHAAEDAEDAYWDTKQEAMREAS